MNIFQKIYNALFNSNPFQHCIDAMDAEIASAIAKVSPQLEHVAEGLRELVLISALTFPMAIAEQNMHGCIADHMSTLAKTNPELHQKIIRESIIQNLIQNHPGSSYRFR